MDFVIIFFGALQVYFSARSFLGGISYLRYFQRFKVNKSALGAGHLPFATVFVPCRGNEPFLVENLESLLRQNYPRYEIIFAVDDIRDPARAVIQHLVSVHDNRKDCMARLIEVRPENRAGRKVELLRAATLVADRASEVFVFADSDVQPRADWLAALVAPLGNEDVGATTGYRWFLPKAWSLAGQIRAAWNASIASALGENRGKNFCWGGSTAIRRSIFEELQIRDRWLGTASDDFILTRELKKANLGIVFVPAALSVSKGDCSFAELLEFTTRQMKITRVYFPNLWLASLLGSGLFVFVTAAAVIVFGVKTVSGDAALQLILGTILLIVALLSIGKIVLRAGAIALALPERAGSVRIQAAMHCLLWPLTTYIFFYNALAAAASRRIVWRGIEYELISDWQLEVIENNDDLSRSDRGK